MTDSPLSVLCERAGIRAPLLFEVRQETSERLEQRQVLLADAGLPEDVAVVFVGSWGRREATRESDNDYFVLTSDREPAAGQAGAAVAAILGEEEGSFREPGREGVFGPNVVSLADLTEKVGLNRDSNTNLTQRMLLVLESVSVYNADLHEAARNAVIDTYLEAPIKACQPPRLFLNDVVRYWRTMCVDFAGKMMERGGQGWGLRNAKLRTTRKMLFASGLLPLLRCGTLDSPQIPRFLRQQFEMPPVDRVAEGFQVFERDDAARRVFGAYERCFEHLQTRATREALDALRSRVDADDSPLFHAIVDLGTKIEQGLLELLFDSPLNDTTRRYGIF